MRAHGYPLEHVLHRFYSIRQDHAAALDECAQIVRQWFETASAMPRSAQPLSQLRIGLQCGGSDAFSGVSGNPLAGWVAREVIRHGGVRQPGRDRRADRSRVLHPREHARPRHGAALPGEDRDLQGARRLARPQRGGQPDRRQQVSRSLQHRHQVDRRGAQEGSGRAPRLRDRLRRADDAAGLLLHGQPGQRPRKHRRPDRRGLQPDLLHHRQRLDHEFSVRADDQVHHHHRALEPAVEGHGRQRRALPRRHVDGGARHGNLPLHGGSGLGHAQCRRARRALAGVDLARLAADGSLASRRAAKRAGARRPADPRRRGECRGGTLRRAAHAARVCAGPGRPDPADQPLLGTDRAADRPGTERHDPGGRARRHRASSLCHTPRAAAPPPARTRSISCGRWPATCCIRS